MNWLADENVPAGSVRLLRSSGIDIVSIQEERPGAPDGDVLALAQEQNRGLLTFDRDFGELIYRESLSCPPTVVYMRFTPTSPDEPAKVLLDVLKRAEMIEGYFVVLDRDSLRRRKLPERTEK